MAEPVVFLDACVLYPPLVRGILLGTAKAGLFAPRWSPRVLDEWRIASARKRGIEAEDATMAARRDMAESFPDASVTPEPEAIDALTLPDDSDNHVLAAAIAAEAAILVTFNLRDFPARRLAAQGIVPRHPDSFLWELFSHDPDAMDRIIRGAGAAADAHGAETLRRALKRAKLPRLAKAFATHADAGL